MVNFALNHYALYFLVLLRMIAFVATSPLLSVRVWPAWAKIGLAAYVALLVAPSVHGSVPDPFTDPGNYVVIALKESMTGLFLGFIATLIFSATTMAGQMFDIQIGFSSATLFDPSQGQATSLTGTFLSTLFTLYFLGLNGLDGLLLCIMNAYQFIGLGAFTLPGATAATLSHLLGLIMTVSVQVAAPLLAALLLTDFTLAMLSRAVPQMNVFVVGLPAKLFVGLSLFVAVMPGVVYMFGRLFQDMFEETNSLLHWLGG